jgi:glycosyltransferase involved in cell wall biosynthesis
VAVGQHPARLTLVIASLGPGGAERVAATLASHWARAGYAVTLLTLDDGSTPPFFELDPAVRHVPLAVTRASRSRAAGLIRNLGRVVVLRRAIRASRPDVVLSFTDSTNVLALTATPSGLPVVVAEHTDPERHPLPGVWRALRALTYPRAAAVVTPNAETRDALPPRVRSAVRVIPNPVTGGAPGARPTAGGRPPLAVAVGRLSEEKGHDLLLEAFAQVAPRFPAWRLAIAGEGPLRAALERQRDRLGLAARVELPGLVRDVGSLLARADLFVLPSRREVFPMALCEAMASGIAPVVAEYRPAVRELVRDGVDGLVVPAGDAVALAAAMGRLMADEAERRRLGGRAPEILERYGVERVVRRWEELLGAVASRRRPSGDG